MNIGEAAAASGVNAKMIRHYERIGLIAPSKRSDSNYRRFDETAVHQLRFVSRARRLGFAIKDIRTLLTLWQTHRPSAEVKNVALSHLASLDARIAELRQMREVIASLADTCHGDARPECPILEDLAG